MVRLIIILLLLSLTGHAEEFHCDITQVKYRGGDGCVHFDDYVKFLDNKCEERPSCFYLPIVEEGVSEYKYLEPDVLLNALAKTSEFIIDDKGNLFVKYVDMNIFTQLKESYIERDYYFDERIAISEIHSRQVKEEIKEIVKEKPVVKEYFKKEATEEKQKVIQILDGSALALLKNPNLKDIKIIFYNKNGKLSKQFISEAESYLLDKGVKKTQFQIKIIE